MKKYILPILLIVWLTACSGDVGSKIVGTWDLLEVGTGNSNPIATFHFKPNGTLEMESAGKKSESTYEVDGSKVTILEKNQEKVREAKVKINKDTMKMTFEDVEKKHPLRTLTFKKVKKE